MKTDPTRNPPSPKDQPGLANEPRPGLGAPPPNDGAEPMTWRGKTTKPAPQDREPLGRNKPIERPAPQEQKDAGAREQERDTGASGQAGIE